MSNLPTPGPALPSPDQEPDAEPSRRERHGASPSGPVSGGAQAGTSLLFLREAPMREAQDLLFFAYRDFTAAADAILHELGLGRAHHRALHFIGRDPGMTVSRLLSVLCITKQSLARVLGVLVRDGFVAQVAGRNDRRQRLLTLTPIGAALERRLFESQRERLLAAYREAGGPAVEGFRRVMRGIMDEPARRTLDQPVASVVSPVRRAG